MTIAIQNPSLASQEQPLAPECQMIGWEPAACLPEKCGLKEGMAVVPVSSNLMGHGPGQTELEGSHVEGVCLHALTQQDVLKQVPILWAAAAAYLSAEGSD